MRYLGAYQQLQKQGFAGEEQRINWLDALRLTNQQADLFGVDYDIGTQKAYPFAAALNPGPIQLRESVMRLRFRLLHEEDLLRFLDLLVAPGRGHLHRGPVLAEAPGHGAASSATSPISRRNASSRGSPPASPATPEKKP